MNKLFKLLVRKLVGDENRFSLAHRILNTTAIVGVMLTLASAISNYLLELPLIATFFSIFSLIYFLGIYLYSILYCKFRLIYNLLNSYLVFIFIPVFWMLNSGSTGGFQYFIFFFLLIILTSTYDRERWFYTGSLIIVILLLLLFEKKFPQYIIQYTDDLARRIDLIISISLSMVSVVLAMEIFMRVYKKANEKLKQQKEEFVIHTNDLKETNIRLNELVKFKEEMTGMIIHDLKNPLNTILNTSHEENIKQTGKQMLHMVTNILDIYKYEDAKMELNLHASSLYEISKMSFSEVNCLAIQKNITIENKIESEIGVFADKDICERIFINMLSNAIKYTPNNGKIIMETANVAENKPNNFITILIRDNGRGIASGKINQVFDKFFQANGSKSDLSHSTGLGLTFCKMAVEAHNGTIGVESNEGIGSTFWFTLPVSGNDYEKCNTFVNKVCVTNELNLSEFDKNYLKPFAETLNRYYVYEISSIKSIINQLDENYCEDITKWVAELKKCVFALNEERYMKLIQMILN